MDTEFELFHDYTYSQPGLHEILTNWRVDMDIYSREPGRHRYSDIIYTVLTYHRISFLLTSVCFLRFMVIESYDYEEIDKTMRYYGTSYATESDFPFNFYLLYLPDALSGNRAKELVDVWMKNMPEGKWPNWVVRDDVFFVVLLAFVSSVCNFCAQSPKLKPMHIKGIVHKKI